jgi:transcriptional regulator with XRE-family HTH domain
MLTVNVEIAERRRLLMGLTKRRLAARARLSPNTVSTALAGREIGVGSASKLAEALGLKPERLIVVSELTCENAVAAAVG